MSNKICVIVVLLQIFFAVVLFSLALDLFLALLGPSDLLHPQIVDATRMGPRSLLFSHLLRVSVPDSCCRKKPTTWRSV